METRASSAGQTRRLRRGDPSPVEKISVRRQLGAPRFHFHKSRRAPRATVSHMLAIVTNLIVPAIEDCLPFYTRLGFAQTVSVPHPPDAGEGAPLGFVILKHGELELMMQTIASLGADVAGLDRDTYRTALYIRVADLEPIRTALEGWPRAVPERTTFYGAREIIVHDPAGNVLSFAEHHS